MADQYGKPPGATAAEDYESPEEYDGQGDSRVTRDLLFSYSAKVGEDAAGNPILQPVEVPRDTELSFEEMGQDALMKGEQNHSFYTTEEREKMESGQDPDAPAAGSDVSALGPHELAEYINGSNPEGKKLTVDQTVALAGTDKDLAQRMLEAENIATDGDPRAGVEAGLTAIIEG